jgi:opacity protein-like surface antigen
MKMKKQIILFFIILFLSPFFSYSQKWKLTRQELIGGIGLANYFGDIGGAEDPEASFISDVDFVYTRPNLMIGYRYRITERLAAKGSLTYANFYGSDAGSKNEARNYAFSSNLIELYGHVEYHITKEKQLITYSTMALRSGLKKLNATVNVYVFAGLGGAYFKPKAKDDFIGSERFNDSKNLTLVLPVGIGAKYPIRSDLYIGMDLSARITTTDFIDGFSPDASKHNDLYYLTTIYVSYKIKPRSRRPRIR